MNGKMEDADSKPIDRAPLACIQCRSRHVKCDATQPTCKRCQRDRKECIYKKSRRGGLDKAALARRKLRLEQEAAARQAQQPQQSLPDVPLLGPMKTTSHDLPDTMLKQFSSHLDLNPPLHLAANSPASAEISFHCNTDRLLEVYYENFWPAFPFTVPKNHMQKRRSTINHGMNSLLLVQQWVGSIYAPWTTSEPYYNAASYALASLTTSTDPWIVQALIVMSFAEFYSDMQSEARQNADRAIALALQLQMNSKAFAKIYGEGDAVLEESWRRTYIFLELLDQHLSVVSNRPMFTLRDIPNLVDLPCEDEDFISGRIPPPATWDEYDMREFADVEIIYSSLVYLLDVSKIVSFSLRMFIKHGRVNDEYVNAVDAKIAAWQSLLPSCKRDPLRQDGTVDEVMFLAHELVAILIASVHRPFSSLTYSSEELSTHSFMSGISPTEPSKMHRTAHTARTLKAIDIQTRLLSIPCANEKHSVALSTVVARLALTQISACNILLDDYGLTIARDRVRLSIGFLSNLGTLWPLAAKIAKELKYVSRMTLSGLASMVTQQQQDNNAEIEMPRDELLWPINPATQIDIYAGLSLPMDWPASLMGYTSSSSSS